MPDAKIRYNPDHSLVEFAPPEGDEYGPIDYPDDDVVVLADADDPGNAFLAVLDDGYEGLKPNTLYKLVEVPTLTEQVDILEVDDDEEDEEDEDEVA
jgi:hypothetical protein